MTRAPMPHSRYRFPWRDQNNCELLIDGKMFYPAMLAHIQAAQHIILLEQYLVISGQMVSQFIAALEQAAQRGVVVYLLLDDYGARELTMSDRQRLQRAPLHCHFFNPFRWSAVYRSLQRDHCKLLIIDGHTAFIGGAGIADAFMFAKADTPAWHDVTVKIQGNMIQDWTSLFITNWQQATRQNLTVNLPVQTAGDQSAQAQLAHGIFNNEIMRAAIRQIKKAQQRVWIATPYFITTRKIRRELRHAALNGVDVRLLLPGPLSDHPWVSYAARRHYQRLLQDKVRLFEYQPRFLHAKAILCDDWVSIGSSNLDRWNQRWNRDANVAIAHPQFAAQVAAFFDMDFSNSIEITAHRWQQRPWQQRLREWWYSHWIVLIQWIEYWVIQFHRNHK